MNKWVVGMLAWMGLLFFAAPSMAGVFSELKEETDLICVKNCMAESKECRADERVLCQQQCALPPNVTMKIGNLSVSVDDNPEEQYRAVLSLQKQIGVQNESVLPVVTTVTYNPLKDLGVQFPYFSIIHFLPRELIGQGDDEGTTTVLYANNIGCNWSKSLNLPVTGGHPAGCRETPKMGTGGWAAVGCKVSDGCCDRAGPDGTPGTGVCTVNSTIAGDGIY